MDWLDQIKEEFMVEHIDQLIRELRSSNQDIRKDAISKLRVLALTRKEYIGELVRAIPSLADALEDENTEVQNAAAKTLGFIGQPSIPALIKVLGKHDLQSKIIAAVAVIDLIQEGRTPDVLSGPEALALIAPLTEALSIRNITLKYHATVAIRFIAQMNPEGPELGKAMPYLITMLDEEEDLKSASISALGHIGGPKEVTHLVKFLDDKERHIRIDSLTAIGKIITRCDCLKKLDEIEKCLELGFAILIEKHQEPEETSKYNMNLSLLRNSLAKRRNEITENKGIILSDIPKPPKRGPVFQTLGRVRNG